MMIQWAQFPPIQYKIDGPDHGESSSQLNREDQKVAWDSGVNHQVPNLQTLDYVPLYLQELFNSKLDF